MKNTAILSLCLMIASLTIQAQQAGKPDSTFHQDGKVSTRLPASTGTLRAVAVQADGKIVVAGSTSNGSNVDFVLVRYKSDGTPDSSFNTTGMVLTDFNNADEFATRVAVRATDGKIIAGGYAMNGSEFDFALVQYNEDGSTDDDFGLNGKVVTSFGGTSFCNAMALQDDGKILLAGYSSQLTNEFAMVRYNTDGSLDSTFSGDGKTLSTPAAGASVLHAICMQPDQKILAAGETLNDSTLRWEIALARYNTDGTPDSSFDGDGSAVHANNNVDHFLNAVAVQSDGKIIGAGYSGTSPSNNNFLFVRFFANGTIDSTFGTNGFLNTAFSNQNNQITAMLMQPDNKMIVAGFATINGITNSVLARYTADGILDSTFGTGGKATTLIGTNDGFYALAWNPDWKIIAAGAAFHGAGFDFTAARFLNDITIVSNSVPLVDYHLSIAPNPVVGAATLKFTLKKNEPVSVQLLDIQGKVIDTFMNKSMEAGSHSTQVLIPEMISSGVYYILLSSPSGMEAVKLMK